MPILRPRLLDESYLHINHMHEDYPHSRRHHASNFENAVDKLHFWPLFALEKRTLENY